MLKFKLNARELKEMMEKAATVINKKSCLPALSRLYFQVDENANLKIWGTNMEHWLEVRSKNVYDTESGVLGIDIEDMKIISKMSGEITFEDITKDANARINIKCGKKNVTIPRYANTDIFLPSMDDTESKILSVKENWLLDTVSKLVVFTAADDKNKMMQVFNFNTKDKRVEALDGHRIGMRSLDTQKIFVTTENPFETVKLHNMCVPVFKKVMSKKSEREIDIYQDKKYIRVEGNDFTYVTRRINGEYYKVKSMLPTNELFRFKPDREAFLEAMKYDSDLTKDITIPVVLHSENGKLYSYIKTARYEAFDTFDTKENTMSNDIYIGFRPTYLTDVFSIADADEPVCAGSKDINPLMIYGNEYSFLLLPVNIRQDKNKIIDAIKKNIERN